MDIVEKVAYLRGLAEGLNLNAEKPETKMFSAIMKVLEDLAEGQEDLEDTINLMSQQLDEVDEDLGQVEEILYGGCDCGCGCEDDYCDCGHDDCDCESGEEAFYEIECPACNEVICVDEGILEDGGIECPNCGEKLEFEIEFDEGEV